MRVETTSSKRDWSLSEVLGPMLNKRFRIVRKSLRKFRKMTRFVACKRQVAQIAWESGSP